MSIVFSCQCRREISVPDAAAGLRARCPRCGATVPVPLASRRRPDPFDSPSWRFLISQAEGRNPGDFGYPLPLPLPLLVTRRRVR
ncbi:MAG TPA: hypothetical protein VF590_06870 [Isosphaeraceae bacterium]|jgi:hypothetical protein